jgi:hypothetical protein
MTFLDRAAHDFRHDWDQAADSRVATPRRATGIDPTIRD